MACYRAHCTLSTFDRQRIANCAPSDDGGEKRVGGGQVRAKPDFLDGNVVCAEEEAKKGQRAQRFLEPYTEIREGVRDTNCEMAIKFSAVIDRFLQNRFHLLFIFL